ncbi:hypothetical protein [Nitrogeniibacter aestuarii]|uniref:hypothetical protein n=1 Tax=Nitrogeniibacter aestuarii TaxID=2815343 RepID=UPI001D12B3F1|nr:hypothetical protein [Nitrogeniibacter aestuarii]
MLSFEFEPPTESTCTCCGGHSTALTRFVYRDGDAYAIYYARFSANHPEHTVIATVSVGDWGEGATPGNRVAFAFEIRSSESEYQVSLIDAEFSPWRDAKVIGRTLDRSEALVHPMVKEVFHIADHMVTDDPVIQGYLNGT